MVAIPALAALYLRLSRRRNTEYLYYPHRLVREALALSQRIRRYAPPALFLLGLAAALFAAARPTLVTTARSEQGTIILAIDVSLSMAATDVAPTRLKAAQTAMAEFVKAQPENVRIGIVAFGGTAHVVQYPTVKKRNVLEALDRLVLQQYTGIGTALIASVLALHPKAGVEGGNDIFANGWEAIAPRGLVPAFHPVEKSQKRITAPTDFSTAIILVSDGCDTIGVSPVKAAEAAAERGIRVYTVGVGTPYGGTANVEGWGSVHAEFQEETLREIARITRGEYFHARNAGKLTRVYGQLTRQAVLDVRKIEIATGLLLGAVALLLAASALSLLWWHRFPVGRAQPLQ